LLAIGGTPTALVAKVATSTVPIVFYLGIDPVEFGLVASLYRPGGNMTEVAALQADLVAKRVEMLHELVPKAATVSCLSLNRQCLLDWLHRHVGELTAQQERNGPIR
jgi:putative ABC transport system substrate-binding protein